MLLVRSLRIRIRRWLDRRHADRIIRHERKELERRRALFLYGEMSALDVIEGYELRADENCKRCHGRGFIGTRVADGMAIPCKCSRACKVKQ